MDVLPHHFYRVIMRAGDDERVGRCFNLKLDEITSDERLTYMQTMKMPFEPTHQFIFRDTQHIRHYIGRLVENSAERLLFDLGGGKEYEFKPERAGE